MWLSIFLKSHLFVYHLSTKWLFYYTALRNLSLSTNCTAFYVKLKKSSLEKRHFLRISNRLHGVLNVMCTSRRMQHSLNWRLPMSSCIYCHIHSINNFELWGLLLCLNLPSCGLSKWRHQHICSIFVYDIHSLGLLFNKNSTRAMNMFATEHTHLWKPLRWSCRWSDHFAITWHLTRV